MEIFENDLLYYTGTPAEIRQLAADLGLKITLFQPFRDFEGASRAQFAANMARARRKFALMRELGCETLLLCSNVQPDCSADSELQVADLRALATLAEEEGSLSAMRPWHGNPCEPLAAGLGAGAAGGQPGVGPGARQLPYSGPRRHAGRATVGAGGENHLCTARRCAVYENGFAGVEPPLPLLSRTGELPLEAFAEQITRCGYRGPGRWDLQ